MEIPFRFVDARASAGDPEAQDRLRPRRGSDHAAGIDLCAAVDAPVEIAPGARALIPTGVAVAIPPGYEGQVRPRSGLAVKHGLTVLNSPGTIDADYRGEVGVILVNLGSEPYVVERFARVAQLVIAAYTHGPIVEVDALPDTERGAGGFGSTGS